MWLGLATALVIALYLVVGSVAPRKLAQFLGTDQARVFSHPLLWALAGLLCINMLVATFTRLGRRLISLGAWASHLGFILLLCGAAWHGFAGVRGEAVSFRTEAGFSDVDQIFISDTFAVVIIEPASGRRFQSPINIPSQVGPVALDEVLNGPDGISFRAIVYGPNGVPESPLPGPALLVSVVGEGLQFVQPLSFHPFTRADFFQRLSLPSGRLLYLAFTREVKPLGATVKIKEAVYETYPGSLVPHDYICEVQIVQAGESRADELSLNKPLRVGDYLIAQGSWLPDATETQQLVFLVSKRSGMWAIWTGCCMIIAGMLFSFYVKPILTGSRGQA